MKDSGVVMLAVGVVLMGVAVCGGEGQRGRQAESAAVEEVGA